MTYSVRLPTHLPQRIYFCRHGQSIGNARGLNDASLASLANHRFPLTEKGLSQAQQLGRYVADAQVFAECSELAVSTFLRAEQTLNAILDENATALPILQDARLDEWWKGIFHSMDQQERELRYPAEDTICAREGWYQYRAPQGEAGKDVEIRLRSFLQDVRGVPFIVAHGQVGAFLDRLLCDKELHRNCEYPNMKNCELWRFTKSGTHYVRESVFTPTDLKA